MNITNMLLIPFIKTSVHTHTHTYPHIIQTYEDWKSDCLILGPNVRRWDPNPPAEEELDLNNIQLKMAQLSRDPTKKGWQSFQISLSNEVRALHLSDPLNAPAWKDLITDFDKKPLGANLQTWAQ